MRGIVATAATGVCDRGAQESGIRMRWRTPRLVTDIQSVAGIIVTGIWLPS